MKIKRMLLVDDSSTARMLIRNFLQIAGQTEVEILEANDGSTALELLEENKVDLIITDIIMPKMDGMVFIQKLRIKPEYKETPVIILTSMRGSNIEGTITDSNIRALQKPISPETLMETLKEFL